MNNNEHAFPMTGNWSRNKGMYLRDYFAAHAPEPPDWFKYKSKLSKPIEPTSWQDMPEGEDRKRCQSWHYDPCFDLEGHLHQYQENWDIYYEQLRQYNKDIGIEFYFAWRWYYADQMLKHREL